MCVSHSNLDGSSASASLFPALLFLTRSTSPCLCPFASLCQLAGHVTMRAFVPGEQRNPLRFKEGGKSLKVTRFPPSFSLTISVWDESRGLWLVSSMEDSPEFSKSTFLCGISSVWSLRFSIKSTMPSLNKRNKTIALPLPYLLLYTDTF